MNIKCTDVSLGLAQLFTAACLKRAAGSAFNSLSSLGLFVSCGIE